MPQQEHLQKKNSCDQCEEITTKHSQTSFFSFFFIAAGKFPWIVKEMKRSLFNIRKTIFLHLNTICCLTHTLNIHLLFCFQSFVLSKNLIDRCHVCRTFRLNILHSSRKFF